MLYSKFVFEGPKKMLNELYSDIESALNKAQTVKAQAGEDTTSVFDGNIIMKEMFPNFYAEACALYHEQTNWDTFRLMKGLSNSSQKQ